MSAIVDKAILAAGLGDLAHARRARDWDAVKRLGGALDHAPLLTLGALADRVRAEEIGDAVIIHVKRPDEALGVPDAGALASRGIDILKLVARARILGVHAAPVCVDWGATGLELAQVALGFGASELTGPLSNRRGLPIAEDAQVKVKGVGMVAVQSLKRRELETLLERAGRRAVFAREDQAAPGGEGEFQHA